MKIAIRYYSKFGHSAQMAQVIGDVMGVKPESIETPLTEEVDILFVGAGLFFGKVNPKSVIRISRCCMAERNPLVFPISRGRIVVFSTTWPSTECACSLSFPDMRVLISVRSGLS